MRTTYLRLLTAAVAALILIAAAPARAADLTILASGALAEALKEMSADFGRQSGNRITLIPDTTGGLTARVEAHEKGDVVIVSAPAMDGLEKSGLTIKQSRVMLARALIGISIRKGTRAPDIATVDAFKRTLRRARAVAYTDPAAGGASGIYFTALIKRLGIADDIRNKSVIRAHGIDVADAVAEGAADIGITFMSEMMPNRSVRVIGPFPADIQDATDYPAEIPAASTQKEAARAFIAYASRMQAAKIYRKWGLEPASH
jgi:molybdate transport system substrate-binding protein